mgnify:CR=1 FL=1
MTKTTTALFIALLTVAYAIEFTYTAGKASAPYIKQAVAFTITCVLYMIEATRYVYTNRQEILDTIGQPFIYQSPAVLKAPRYIRFTRPANTLRLAV